MAKAREEAEVLSVAGREVRISHPSKLYFSRELRLTKLDVVTGRDEVPVCVG